MALRATLFKRAFLFRFEARTSRGKMKDRTSWFLKIHDDREHGIFGVGEVAPLPGLSIELTDTFGADLEKFVEAFNASAIPSCPATLTEINHLIEERFIDITAKSSFVFALEVALLDLASGGRRRIFESGFTQGNLIPINGLIWMGGMDFMLQQIEIKLRDGFRCIKLKVGGLDFERECDILQYVRRKYFRDQVTIRLDANGAFKPEDADFKLHELSKYDIQSIEQPLKQGSPHLPALCKSTPIPIALDEELIGVKRSERTEVLERIKPQFIILKPSLHGGLLACEDWISRASQLGIGWWLTSALESNVGLNALAQFAGRFPITLHQGLGTGNLYDNNFSSPLEIDKKGLLGLNSRETWNAEEFN
jgi:o-succinylbenzoate synthase